MKEPCLHIKVLYIHFFVVTWYKGYINVYEECAVGTKGTQWDWEKPNSGASQS